MKRKPIFNEKLYIDNILLTHDAKNLDIELYQLVQLLSIYFYQYEGYDNKNDLAMRVNQELLLFNFDGYYYELWYKNILNICQYVIKKDLKMKDMFIVDIYQDEYESIKNCGDFKHQKLLFTLNVLARWNNDSGWTPMQLTLSQIKEMANITCSSSEFNKLFYDLIQNGYLISMRKADKFIYKIVYFNQDKNIDKFMTISSFENIGNYYYVSQVNTHTMCSLCGRLVKKTNNKVKYCKKCADKIHKEQKKIRYKTLRS